MIAYIEGKLVEVTDTAVIVDVNGIGYQIICANPFHFQSNLNKNVKIHTYQHVREDAQILYGFKDYDEKLLFSHVITVSGIGPKSGLAIVGRTSVDEFVLAIEEEDEKYLIQFPGVGKKTARQMILDLKGKLPFEVKQSADQVKNISENETALNEATAALGVLGYSEREIKAIVPKLRQSKLTTTDDYIKHGLSLLMKS